jgi:hypothetical protein
MLKANSEDEVASASYSLCDLGPAPPLWVSVSLALKAERYCIKLPGAWATVEWWCMW